MRRLQNEPNAAICSESALQANRKLSNAIFVIMDFLNIAVSSAESGVLDVDVADVGLSAAAR